MWYVTFKLNVFNICIEFCLKIDLKKLNHTFGDLKFLTDPLVQLHVSSRVQLSKIFWSLSGYQKKLSFKKGVGVGWGGWCSAETEKPSFSRSVSKKNEELAITGMLCFI